MKKTVRETRGPAPPNPDRASNNVQVGRRRSNFVYADLAKHLLAGGEDVVEISALGEIIADAVNVVEMLKNQEMVVVTKIVTSAGAATEARKPDSDQISIFVSKAPGFKAKYDKQMEERKAEKKE